MGIRSTNPSQSFSDDFSNSGTEALGASPITSPITATGGDTTLTITGYKVHIFTTTGASTFVVSSGNGPVEYLVVAGGGSGAAQYGGGGGAGGLRTNLAGHPKAGETFPVTPGTYPVTVGAGGVFATPPGMFGQNGANSSFGPIVATAGGGGGGPGLDPPSSTFQAPWYPNTNGGPGGSGGGSAGRTGGGGNLNGGSGNAGGFPTPTREGFDGGDGVAPGPRAGGGGGGAGGAGTDGTGSQAGPG